MTMRHLTAKIFAEEVGCDWLTPEWEAPSLGGGSGASLYCHSAATYEEQQMGFSNTTREEVETMVHRCSLVNWLGYFNFQMSSVKPPVNGSFRIVEVLRMLKGSTYFLLAFLVRIEASAACWMVDDLDTAVGVGIDSQNSPIHTRLVARYSRPRTPPSSPAPPGRASSHFTS